MSWTIFLFIIVTVIKTFVATRAAFLAAELAEEFAAMSLVYTVVEGNAKASGFFKGEVCTHLF